MKAIREAEWSGLAPPVVKESPHPMFGRGIADAMRLVFAGTPEVGAAVAAGAARRAGTRWSPSSPVRTRRPDAGARLDAVAGRRAARPSTASRCSSRPTPRDPDFLDRLARDRARTAARSSPTAR